jgi:ABC-type spermidine/putrescine transport system permease subunit II
VAATFGTLFALILHYRIVRGRAALQALVALPLALPGIVLGISLAIVFRQIGLTPGYLTVVLGHATFITPVVMFLVMQRLNTSDPTLEQASMDLGGGRLKTFWHVTLPEIRLAVFAACLLGFTLSFDEITITLFLTGLDQTLPVYVWNLLRFGFTPEVNAVFTVIGVGSVILIVLAAVILNRTTRRAARGQGLAADGTTDMVPGASG